MTARTHDAFAFASLLTIAILYPPETLNLATLMTSLVANIVGTLIPDMDQASNRLWDLLPAGDHVGKIFRRIFLRHRTLSHSLLGAFLIYKVLEWGLPKLLNSNFIDVHIVFLSVMIGYGSHLIADGLTKDGIPLFFPFPLSIGFPPISSLRITTDSWVEKFLVLPCVAGYVVWLFTQNQEKLLQILRLAVK